MLRTCRPVQMSACVKGACTPHQLPQRRVLRRLPAALAPVHTEHAHTARSALLPVFLVPAARHLGLSALPKKPRSGDWLAVEASGSWALERHVFP